MEILTIPTATHPLTAFFHPAASGRRRPLLVVCHGFCGSAEGGGALDLAASLQKQGVSLLRFRFTPHRCLSQQVAEIGAVMDFCHTELTSDVALLGRSMGAAAALIFAASGARKVSGLCLMAAPADLPSTFRGILGADYERLATGHSITAYHAGEPVHLDSDFIRDFDRYDLLWAVRQISPTPVFLIHGLDDDTVPVEHGRQLFAAAGEPKQLLMLPNHGHSFTGCSERFVSNITEWLTRQIFPAPL